MSRGPYWMPTRAGAPRMGEAKMVDPVVGGLTDPFHDIHMGVTAENLAESHDISREAAGRILGRVAPARAARAQEQGLFDERDRSRRAQVEEGHGRVRPATSTCARTRRWRRSAS